MSLSDDLRLYVLRRKKEKMQLKREVMGGKVFISRQSWHFLFEDNIIEVFLLICTLSWCVNSHVSRQGRSINRKNESINIEES